MTVDLIIIGGGSAAFAAAIKTSELGGRAIIINEGLPVGGTCVNVGCVPSKTMIRAAEAHYRSANHNFDGIDSSSRVTDFGAITRQTQELVDELRQGKYIDVVADDPNIEIVDARATISEPNTVLAGGCEYKAKNILIATGARTYVPTIPGIANVPYLTNDTLYALSELPERLIVLGGGYVALENAQMFARLGSSVTMLQRSGRILKTQSEEITSALRKFLETDGVDIRTGVTVAAVRSSPAGIQVDVSIADHLSTTIEGSHLFIATGRMGNTDGMNLEKLGIEIGKSGFLVVDDTLRTNIADISGAGDVIGGQQFVYSAAYEGSLVAENVLRGMHKKRDYTALPWVIFTDPQLAGVGMDEKEAGRAGINYEATRLDLVHVSRARASRDTRGFIKLIRDVDTDLLVGARILAHEGSELLMEIVLAIKYGITVDQIKSTFHPYLTLGEGIKLAAISFGKDVAKLSCCAA